MDTMTATASPPPSSGRGTKRRVDDPSPLSNQSKSSRSVWWLIDTAPTVGLKIEAMRQLVLLAYNVSEEDATRLARPSSAWLFVSWDEIRYRVLSAVTGGSERDENRFHLRLILSILATHYQDRAMGDRGRRWQRDAFAKRSKTPLVDVIRPLLDNLGAFTEMVGGKPRRETSIHLSDLNGRDVEEAAFYLQTFSSRSDSTRTESTDSISEAF